MRIATIFVLLSASLWGHCTKYSQVGNTCTTGSGAGICTQSQHNCALPPTYTCVSAIPPPTPPYDRCSLSVIPAHPRLMLNDTVADTWEPSKSRLQAIVGRIMAGGNATAITDFSTLQSLITSAVPGVGDHNNDANLDQLLAYAFAYQTYHYNGDDTTAAHTDIRFGQTARRGDPAAFENQVKLLRHDGQSLAR